MFFKRLLFSSRTRTYVFGGSSSVLLASLGTLAAADLTSKDDVVLPGEEAAAANRRKQEALLRQLLGVDSNSTPLDLSGLLPTREQQLERLKKTQLDVLVVGAGCVGAGSALDATSRGLKVGLVEREDFASGTSSRSTKMIHGGVRYLEKAVMNFDKGQFDLVREALYERSTFFTIAPHLSRPLPIITPLYKWYEIPYIYAGLKMYDWVSGQHSLHPSKIISREKCIKKEPMIRKEGLKGAVLYYDGQFDDARMNVSIAMTAAAMGAAVANHTEVVRLLKDANNRVSGARVRDLLTGEEFDVQARVVINATGALSDALNKMDRPDARSGTVASAGVHIVFDHTFFENATNPYDLPSTGLLIPKTEDGRVVFLLPWNNSLLAGTTDNPAKAESNPTPTKEDIEYLIKFMNHYFSVEFTPDMVSSAWAGIRPLAAPAEGSGGGTAAVSREHSIVVSPSGLVSVTGGKWTTYRKMSEEVIDKALDSAGIVAPKASSTATLKLAGAHTFPGNNPRFFAKILRVRHAVDRDVSFYLTHKYGDLSPLVLSYDADAYVEHSLDELASRQAHGAPNAKPNKYNATPAWWDRSKPGRKRSGEANKPYERLHEQYPYLMCEVDYAVKVEEARSTVDVVVNRLRVPFFNAKLAISVIPRVSERMAKLLNWSEDEKKARSEEAFAYVRKMTGGVVEGYPNPTA